MSATLKDIAKETGLSTATISKYINGVKLKEKNSILIENAIKKLNYTVNEYARGLKSNKSKTIGVVIPELSNLFITQIITNMEKLLRTKGYSTIICDCHTDEKIEFEAVNFLLSKRVDGIINMPVDKKGEHLKLAIEKKIPIVLIDREIEEIKNVTESVLVDNMQATYNATEHLLLNGHTEIGVILGPKDIYTSKLRLKGYKKALENFKITYNSNNVEFSDYTVEGGYESFGKLLKKNNKITAIFTTNYEMTLGAIIAINEKGINIPNDLSFIGFDNLDLAKITQPKLTIVTQPLEQIGMYAAELMLRKINNFEDNSFYSNLPTEMIYGNSVKKIL